MAVSASPWILYLSISQTVDTRSRSRSPIQDLRAIGTPSTLQIVARLCALGTGIVTPQTPSPNNDLFDSLARDASRWWGPQVKVLVGGALCTLGRISRDITVETWSIAVQTLLSFLDLSIHWALYTWTHCDTPVESLGSRTSQTRVGIRGEIACLTTRITSETSSILDDVSAPITGDASSWAGVFSQVSPWFARLAFGGIADYRAGCAWGVTCLAVCAWDLVLRKSCSSAWNALRGWGAWERVLEICVGLAGQTIIVRTRVLACFTYFVNFNFLEWDESTWIVTTATVISINVLPICCVAGPTYIPTIDQDVLVGLLALGALIIGSPTAGKTYIIRDEYYFAYSRSGMLCTPKDCWRWCPGILHLLCTPHTSYSAHPDTSS